MSKNFKIINGELYRRSIAGSWCKAGAGCIYVDRRGWVMEDLGQGRVRALHPLRQIPFGLDKE